MLRKIVIGLFFCFVLPLSVALPNVHGASVPTAVALQAHDPIWIRSDSDFVSSNGVTGGTGTNSDPFVIQGWDIDLRCLPCITRVPAGVGIRVETTAAHFLIRNISIHDGGTGGTTGFGLGGIMFSNVKNGVVQSAVLERDQIGIDVEYSSHNLFSGNRIDSNDAPFLVASSSFNTFILNNASSPGVASFLVRDSTDNLFLRNRIEGGYAGFQLVSAFTVTTRNTLAFNTINWKGGGSGQLVQEQDGFYLSGASGNILEYNIVSWSGTCVNSFAYTCPDGFHLQDGSNYNLLKSNQASGNPNDGFIIETSSNNLLIDNVAHGSHPPLPGPGALVGYGAGFAFFTASNNNVVSNLAYDNNAGFDLAFSSHNHFTSNLARGNWDGFDLVENSVLNVFDRNEVYGSTLYAGFYLDSDQGSGVNGNTFVNNIVHDNPYGFMLGFLGLGGIDNNTLAANIAYSNNVGVFINGAGNTKVYDKALFNNKVGIDATTTVVGGGGALIVNNFLSNTVNAIDGGTGDVYNIAKTAANSVNIIGGPYLGGNFWSNYRGGDGDHDGLGDIPYSQIDPSTGLVLLTDNYPLVFAPPSGTSPDFAMVPLNSFGAYQGSNGTLVLALVSQNGFSGAVSLSAKISPSTSNGPRIGFRPSTLTLVSGGALASAVNVTSTSLSGNYSVDITGSIGTISHTVKVPLTVVPVAKLQPTAIGVLCNPTTVAVSHSTDCVATVAELDPAATSGPTGTVSFTPSGTCTLIVAGSSSTCSISITPSTAGTLSISASYAGSTTDAASTAATSLIVIVGSTSTKIVCSPSSININQPSTCSATVADTSPGISSNSPSGTVLWYTPSSGSFSVTTCTLVVTTASDGCSVTYTPTAGGSHQITGSYGGDATHPSSSGSFVVAVAIDPTASTVICVPATLAPGQTTTCTASVVDTATAPTTPTGTVSFTPSGSCTLSGNTASSRCSVNLTPSVPGPMTVQASYPGDTTHAISSGSTSVSVVMRSTLTMITCIPASLLIMQATSCSATVTDSAGGTSNTPSGSVRFGVSGLTGTFSSVSCVLTGGSCSIVFTPSTGGAATITGIYGGDLAHSISSGSAAVTVSKRSASISLSCAPSSVSVGFATVCTAVVTDLSASPALTPGGTVVFITSGNGAFASPSCNLGGTGTTGTCSVTYTPSGVTAGTEVITGDYLGDLGHISATNSFSLTIKIVHASSVALSCTPSTVVVGQTTSCTATVNDVSNNPSTPTGTVSFASDGSGSFGPSDSCLLATGLTGSANCTVSLTPTAVVSGTVAITATYGGDSVHTVSHGSTNISTKNGLTATTASVSCSPASTTVGTTFTCNVTISGSSPTGIVTLSTTSQSGGAVAPLATSCNLISGRCSVSLEATSAGVITISATYSGDTGNKASSGSSSLTVVRQVNPAAPLGSSFTASLLLAASIIVAVLVASILVVLMVRRRGSL